MCAKIVKLIGRHRICCAFFTIINRVRTFLNSFNVKCMGKSGA